MTFSGEPLPVPCFLVNNLSLSSEEQCKFIIDNDCLEGDSLIDYAHLAFCDLGLEYRALCLLLLFCLLLLLFLTLGGIADELLCPSLLTVAKNLRMSDSLAGITLLAFGNASPDIFASIAAASDDRSELIVGELLGAGVFCTSIVAGLIFIRTDFKLATRPILRDASFYLLALSLTWWYCYSERITFYGSLTFIVIYVIYLVVALGAQAIHARIRGDYPIAKTQTEHGIELDEPDKKQNENWLDWRQASIRSSKSAKSLSRANSDTAALTPGTKRPTDGPHSAQVGGGAPFKTPSATQQLETRLYLAMQAKTPPQPQQAALSYEQGYQNQAFEADSKPATSEVAAGSQFDPEPGSHSQPTKGELVATMGHLDATNPEAKRAPLSLNEWDDFLCHINPVDTSDWQQTSLAGKLVSLVRAPLMFLAVLTIPLVDLEKRQNNWCRLLNSFHCCSCPIALVHVFGIADSRALFGVPLVVLVTCLGTLAALLMLNLTEPSVAPSQHRLFAYVGFIMSICWTFMLATEIISLLKTVGILFSLSDTAIGLGILAWGNSLGDIVANVSLAQAGYPRMALGASIGAPLLNLLFGFGLAFTLNLEPGSYSVVRYSPTISLLCSTLATILVSIMIFASLPPHRSRKFFGYLLISVYGIYFALAVCIEYGIIKW